MSKVYYGKKKSPATLIIIMTCILVILIGGLLAFVGKGYSKITEENKRLVSENNDLTKNNSDLKNKNNNLSTVNVDLINRLDSKTQENNKLVNDNQLLTTENEQLKNENKTLLEQQHSTYVEPDGYVYSLVATSTEGEILKIIDYSSSLDKFVIDYEEMRTIRRFSAFDNVSWTARRYQKYTITNSDGSTKSVFDNTFTNVMFGHGSGDTTYFDLTFSIEWYGGCGLNSYKYDFENRESVNNSVCGIFIMPDFNSNGNDEYETGNGNYVVPLTLYIGAPGGRPDMFRLDRNNLL